MLLFLHFNLCENAISMKNICKYSAITNNISLLGPMRMHNENNNTNNDRNYQLTINFDINWILLDKSKLFKQIKARLDK